MANKPAPQDHKKKQDTPKSVAVKRTIGDREVDGFEVTHRGFTVFVEKEAFNDFEFLEDLANIENRKAQVFPRLLRRLIGDDYQIVMDGLRDKDTGRVSIEAGITYANDIIEAVNPNG